MIYERIRITKCLIIFLLIITAHLSCIQNPVQHDLESDQNTKQQVTQRPLLSSIVQDKNGVLWGFRNDSVYTWNEKSITLSFTVNLHEYSRISDLLLDRQESVLILYDNILGRISEKQGKYVVDTLWTLSLSVIFGKYSTDYSGNVWLYDSDFGRGRLIKWDGIQINEFLLNDYEQPDSFLSSGFIAGGDSCVYILSKEMAGGIVVDKFSENDSTLKSFSYTIDSKPFLVQQVFALNDKLDIIIETSDRTISGRDVILKAKYLLLDIDGNQINERQELTDYYRRDKKIRSGPDEVFLYNYYRLSKITSNSVAEKRISLECNGLFIDTSGTIRLYSNTTGKTITISTLPGF